MKHIRTADRINMAIDTIDTPPCILDIAGVSTIFNDVLPSGNLK